jgi:hypothetical protein
MALLGGLEHGIYVDKEDDDECQGMSIAQIHQYYGQDIHGYDDEVSDEEGEQHQAEFDVDVDDEDSMSDDSDASEDCFAGLSGSEDAEMEELEDPDVVCIIIISLVYVYDTILGPFSGAV